MRQAVKRTVCMLLGIMMIFACAGFLMSNTAEAKTNANGKLSISGEQNYKYSQQLLQLINKERKKAGLSELKLDKTLTNAAITRAIELSVYIPQSSPHRRPNGELSKSANSQICYEDCLESYGSGFGPKEAFNGWMNSPPHKKGILLSSAKSVGIGCISMGLGKYWVLDFSNAEAKSIQKSKKTVFYTKKITVLPEYLKNSYFKLVNHYNILNVGEKRTLPVEYESQYTICPTCLNASSFTWSSSNSSVASVSKKGIVKAKKAGSVKITAKLKTGTKVKFSTILKVL